MSGIRALKNFALKTFSLISVITTGTTPIRATWLFTSLKLETAFTVHEERGFGSETEQQFASENAEQQCGTQVSAQCAVPLHDERSLRMLKKLYTTRNFACRRQLGWSIFISQLY